MTLESLLRAAALAFQVFGALVSLVSIAAYAWGRYKIAYQRATGRGVPRTRWTVRLDIAADVAVNVLGAINRRRKAAGLAPLFLPTEPAADDALPSRPSRPPPASAPAPPTTSGDTAPCRRCPGPPPAPHPRPVRAAAARDPALLDHVATAAPSPLTLARRTIMQTLTVRRFAAALLLLAASVLSGMRCHPRLPPVSGCAPLTTSCIGDAPQVCSASQRWEPAGDTTCGALGGVCVEDTRGAHCARVRDGGADVVDAADGGAP